MTIIQDLTKAYRLTQKARKRGLDVGLGRPMTGFKRSYWYATMEGCLLQGELNKAVKTVFDGFDEETKHTLTFSPSIGEWAARARFWKDALRPALPAQQYSAVMGAILSHYICCARQGLEDKTATLY